MRKPAKRIESGSTDDEVWLKCWGVAVAAKMTGQEAIAEADRALAAFKGRFGRHPSEAQQMIARNEGG